MEGHYHLELEKPEELVEDEDEGDDSYYINEESLDTAIEKAKKIGGGLRGYGFLCRFGCGMYHKLLESEVAKLKKAFPDLDERKHDLYGKQ